MRLRLLSLDLNTSRLSSILTLEGIIWTSSAAVRNLRVKLDKDTRSFTSHITFLELASLTFTIFLTLGKFCLRVKLVQTLVTPRLDYCNSVLLSCPKMTLNCCRKRSDEDKQSFKKQTPPLLLRLGLHFFIFDEAYS